MRDGETSGDRSARFDRRSFLRGAIAIACVSPVFAAGCTGRQIVTSGADAGDGSNADAGTDAGGIDGWSIPDGTMLTPPHYATLAALMDALIPGDATTPGASDANAAWYVDQLLGAFRTDPPRIYAGGPYSGRHGGRDSFSTFQPLTRVETLRWRTFIEGSRGMPEREWNGPVIGLIQKYEVGLDALEAAAQGVSQRRFTAMVRAARRSVLQTFDAAFVQMAYEHAVEGTYGDPVYGGNLALRGWTAIDYEGDRQPIGYTALQMSNPEEG